MTQILSTILRVSLFSALIFGAGVPSAEAQRKKKKGEPELAPAPPPVVARKVMAQQGETIAIPLGIHGSRSEQLEFLIRVKPKRGKLSAMTSTGLNSATVNYAAPKDGVEDHFTYAVRSKEGVSAPALVTITLNARPTLPPKPSAPESLDFPAVTIGERSTVTFDISNVGEGLLDGNLKVDEPWRVEDQPNFRLGPGAKTTFKLIFEPKKPGAFRGQAELGTNPPRVILLTGSAQMPFSVTPNRLWIEANRGGQTRMGKIQIENHSDQAHQVTIAPGERLLMDKTVDVPAKGKLEVTVLAAPTIATGFEEVVKLSAGDWKAEIPVQVAALGAVLKWAKPSEPAAPGVAGEKSEWTVKLENNGGKSASVHLSVNPPFELEPTKVELAAGGKAEIRVIGNGLIAGKHVASISAETEEKSEKLAFEVEMKEGAARPARTSPKAPAEMKPVANVEQAERASAAEFDPRAPGRAEHPNAMGDFVSEVGPDRATLQWPAKIGAATDLSIEERQLSKSPDGVLKITWAPLPGVTIQGEGDPKRAELPRLQPARLYTVRVRSGDETLFTAQFYTKPKPPLLPFGWQGIVLTLLALTLIGIGWWKWKHRSASKW